MQDDPKTTPTGRSQDQTGEPSAASGGGDPGKTFTQEELDRIIAERLKREREKYADYDQLKKDAEELRKRREAEMSEAEKAKAAKEEAEAKLKAKEAELEALRLEQLRTRLVTEAGLPIALASRVRGTTEDEIKADIEELKKLVGPAGKGPVGSGTNPAGAPQKNPWATETLNLTEQARILRENPALAAQLKREAGAG
jgi:multidrug efflux pump subunit AcrA (membrane-fusion protein)